MPKGVQPAPARCNRGTESPMTTHEATHGGTRKGAHEDASEGTHKSAHQGPMKGSESAACLAGLINIKALPAERAVGARGGPPPRPAREQSKGKKRKGAQPVSPQARQQSELKGAREKKNGGDVMMGTAK